MTETKEQRASNTFTFPRPFHAVHNTHGPLRVIAGGDVEGNSASYFCIDGDGLGRWLSAREVKIIEPDYLPLDRKTLANMSVSAVSGR
jgi:hypothetical protein